MKVIHRTVTPGYINIGSGEWDQEMFVFYAIDKDGIEYYTISLYDQHREGEEVESNICWKKVPHI